MKIARSGSTRAKKGAKWKKGQACSSNPTRRKFRDAVGTGTFNNIIKESCLTAAALNQHDANYSLSTLDSFFQKSVGPKEADTDDKNDLVHEVDEVRTVASTWATEFSACSNMSFSRLITNWDPSSALHKEMLVVLAAVTEVIREQGGQETESEYLGAFLTSLTTLESDMSVTATVALTNIVIKRVPPSLIRQRFSDISQVVWALLTRYAESDHNAILCSLLNIGSFVCRQLDISHWTSENALKKSETCRLFNAIIVFVTHSKPRVRRAAQKNICNLMRSSSDHPSAVLCGAYVNDRLEEFRRSGNTVSLLHILTFLSHGLPLLPSKNIKTLAESVLKAMTLGEPLVVIQGMTTISNMFMYETTQLVIRPDLNAKLVNALYDFQPGLGDPQPLIAWLMAMRSALVHLHKADVALFAMNVGKFISVSLRVFLCESDAVRTVTEKVVIELLQLCGSIENEMKTPKPNGSQQTPAEKIVVALEGTLKYQFHLAWPNVLAVWGVAFSSLAKVLPERLSESVPTLADLRELDNFEYGMHLDHTVGAAVRALGPQRVLEKVPLNITGVEDDPNFPRSWLMPVLRDNIKETELKFFIEYFFPLTGNLSRAEALAKQAGKKHMEIAYRVLGNQVWSLLPAFCTRTADVQETFPKVAQTLGILLTARPERRLSVLSALRKLITTSTAPDVIGRFSKNYLPILCNLYIKKMEAERLSVYETIRAFVTVSEKELCCTMFNTAMEKSKTAEGEDADFVKIAVADIARALLPKVTEVEGELLYDHCVANLRSGVRRQQKKAYLILEDLFRAECCRQLVERKLDEIQKLLVTSALKVATASKAPRLRCLRSVLAGLSSPNQQFVVAVIPEAVLCCRESAAKVKQAALEVVVECADALQRWSIPNAFGQYISLLMGGLAGSPTSISASITAIGYCIRHFREQLQESEELLRQLVEAVCTLVVSPSREIVKAALDFIKGIFTLVEMSQLAKFADLIISRVCGMMTDDCANHFRLKVKGILIRFVRRFGYDLVFRMVPDSHYKVLSNIRKLENRRRKGRSMASGSGGSDSEEEDGDAKTRQSHRSRRGDTFDDMLGSDSDSNGNKEDDETESQAQQERRKKKCGAWLKEGDEEIVDLMDPSAMRNISTTDPEKYKQKLAKKLTPKQAAEKAGFKISDDGKLIITKEMIEKDNPRGKKRNREAEPEDSDLEDIDNLLGALSGYAKSSRTKSLKSVTSHKSTKSVKSSMSAGSEYRSKKAKGDVKSKKQKYDPYAYIPMNRMALNKRKRARMSGQYKNIVKGATKGARKGHKQRPRTEH
ncbi:RRP12 protein-like [Tropilaelaps mercedesae]|uniref:RRP12 protein-like n=1 Tax=Tropilaelaps mercedesae TaxID=418985 RepID=A0A1V9XSE9_9ACAR|nr:RRP12 protein-like [Tropilaelaps mercedesae]